MKLGLRRLRILAQTGAGPYGIDLEFSDGLTVLRADNSMGKSTVANAILYVLGGEGMLGPSWPKILKYCLYEYLQTDDGDKLPIVESSITAELVNQRGEGLTVRRFVVNEDIDKDLVQLWDGYALSQPQVAKRRSDMFLRLGGSASRPDGFHFQLANFVGWDLPEVPRFDGKSSPLYLQLLFPFLFVEQQVGWSGVQANVPRFLQVRDPGRRAVEFLLALDANKRSTRREELRAREQKVRQEWAAALAEFRGSIRQEPIRIRDLPDRPVASWPPDPAPHIEAFEDSHWDHLDSASERCRLRLRELSEQEIPRVEAVAFDTENSLDSLEVQHHQLAAAHAILVREVDADASDLDRIDDRLESLRIDRLRHQDAEKVASMGGSPARELHEGRCPTCDQDWPIALLGGREEAEPVMTIGEHLQLIEQEDRSLKSLRKGSELVLRDRTDRERAIRQQLSEVRAEIRAHKQTLVSEGQVPSAAAIRERLLLEDRLRRLDEARLELARLVERLGELAATHKKVKAELASLAGSDLSARDKRQLGKFRDRFLGQLAEYGFVSLDGVTLSEETYLPEREGFDLTHEVSASDTIRLIWAYLSALMETGSESGGNHPGLLILDEPRQQDIESSSLREFLAHSSTARAHGQQVFATITTPVTQFASPALGDATIIDFAPRMHVLQHLGD